MSTLTVDQKTALALSYIAMIADQVGDVTGHGDWSVFGANARQSLQQGSTEAGLNYFMHFMGAISPNEDNGQWGIIQSAFLAQKGKSPEDMINGLLQGMSALAKGAHNIHQWAELKGFSNLLLSPNLNTWTTYPDRNIEMDDVRATFAALPETYSRAYYRADRGPIAVVAMLQSHFKGVSAYGSHLIFTHTNVGSGGGVGKVLIGCQPDYAFAHAVDTGSPVDVKPGSLQHPCSSQACGQYMAMGLQTSADNTTDSCIKFYDLSAITTKTSQGQTIAEIGQVDWPDGINGVGLTKEHGPDGKYLLAGIQGSHLKIVRSKDSSLYKDGKLTDFDFANPVVDNNKFDQSGCGLALITQSDGSIFLVTMDGDPETALPVKSNFVKLYQLDAGQREMRDLGLRRELPVTDISATLKRLEDTPLVWVRVLKPIVDMIINKAGNVKSGLSLFNSNFRWGKGLEITSPTSFRVFATDRNSIPWSQIPSEFLFGSGYSDDYSVCLWDARRQSKVAPPDHLEARPS